MDSISDFDISSDHRVVPPIVRIVYECTGIPLSDLTL
jgi:hypothetical protein